MNASYSFSLQLSKGTKSILGCCTSVSVNTIRLHCKLATQ